MTLNKWQRLLYAHCGDLTRQVSDLLTGDADGWNTDRGYWLSHAEAKIDIWICNKAYGLLLRVWPIKPGFPCEIKPNWRERSLLWSLIKLRREATQGQIKRARAAEVIRQRREAA